MVIVPAGNGRVAIGVRRVAFQSWTFFPPTASVRPSGLYATPLGAFPVTRTGLGSVHSDTVPPASPAASRPVPSQASDVTGCECGSVAISERVDTFQTSTLATAVPAATCVPSGLNATAFSQFTEPVRVPSGMARPSLSRHSHSLWSWLAAASRLPSRAERHPRHQAPRAGQRPAQRLRRRRAVDVPQPHRAVRAARRQDRPAGANATDCTYPARPGQWLAERSRMRRVARRPRAAPPRPRCPPPASGRRG